MKASELRLGNYIYDLALGVCKVRGITDGGIWISNNSGPGTEVAFQPIPLTEEWLIKFGFKTTDKYQLDFKFPNDRDDDHVISKNGDNGWYYGFENYQLRIPAVNLLYVHQLQNLYFVLTGQELTIKDKC